MVGGGQLARMTVAAAIALDIRLRVLAESAESSAAQVAADVVIGDHDDLDTLREFAAGCDVLTFDHEHVPSEHLEALEADGVVVRPGSAALRHAQDKVVMRQALSRSGVPVPDWELVADVAALAAFGARVGWPVVIKTPRGGYDGRGVRLVGAAGEAADWLARGPVLAERRVEFGRELAVLLARSPHGQAAVYPVVQTVQRTGICREVLVPAPISEARALAAQQVALRIAGELAVVGLLAVEMFDTAAGVVVNELAMRPHNSGHWTIDGAVTSQFEQHLRAVLDLAAGRGVDARPARGDGQRARRRRARPVRRLLALHGPRPGAQDPQLRQEGAARPQGRARDRERRRPRGPAGTGAARGGLPGRRTRPDRREAKVAEPDAPPSAARSAAPVVGVVMGSDSDWG